MDKNEFDSWVNRAKERMINMAKQSRFPDDNMDVISTIAEFTPTEVTPKNENTYENFMLKNPKTGTLKVQVFTANQALPISNVDIIVSKEFDGGTKVFYKVKTDQNGIIDGMILPAPDKDLSEQPSDIQPFALYDIFANHPNYVQEKDLQAQVFDGIKSIQSFNMVPITK